MTVLAWIAAIWVACLAIGAAFGVLGKIIWLAILLSVFIALVNYAKDKRDGD